jgi:hypothetical protein
MYWKSMMRHELIGMIGFNDTQNESTIILDSLVTR